MNETNSALQFIRPEVRNSGGMGGPSVAGFEHRMQWNENPFDFPPDLKEEALRRYAALAWSRYPTGLRPTDLTERIAEHSGVTPEMITAGPGSSSIIKAIIDALIAPGDRVVMPTPTFLLYRRFASLAGAAIHPVPTSPDDDFAQPVSDLIVCARTNEAKLVALCAPNNPTGTVYSPEDVARIADESGALVVVDEAYQEFSGQEMRPLLDRFDNVVLLRTFSKAYAMAGLRVGYALAAPGLAQEIDKTNLPFPIAVFSQITAMVALENADRFRAMTDRIVSERERLAAALNALEGVRVFPSGTNFILAQLDQPTDELVRYLREEHSLLVNNMAAYPELVNCLRITVGTAEENDLLAQVMGMYMG
jgi:histidinol-phosphate aminotransferase